MNDHSLNDPQLQSLEARLAAMAPRASAAEQQQLLYQCAFAAGRSASGKLIRRWQVAVGTLAALLLAVSVSLVQDRFLPARQVVEVPVSPREAAQQSLPNHPEPLQSLPTPKSVELDAWQVPESMRFGSGPVLAQSQPSDPHQRSLTVGAMTRRVTP